MSVPSSQPSEPTVPRTVLQPVPPWKVITVVVVVGVVTASAVTALWWAGTRGLVGSELVRARFDALRIGLSIGIGGGGLFALYLAWRRQRSTEADLDNRERALAHQEQVAADTKAHLERVAAATEAHQERVAITTEDDARARRVTDLYTKAVDQLGSDKAPVRLGGLYALERLAQDNPDQRQTIVNVLCAYLRMPFTLPGVRPGDDAPDDHHTRFNERTQEREVRLTAQRILQNHLTPGPGQDKPLQTFWSDMDLELTNAHLINIDFQHCRISHGAFANVQFTGVALFENTQFTSVAWFGDSQFTSDALFNHAQFTSVAGFDDAQFTGDALFNHAQFTSAAWFNRAQFTGDALFNNARFNNAQFNNTQFASTAEFDGAHFIGDALFNHAQFTSDVRFVNAQFTGATRFVDAQFTGATRFDRVQFTNDPWFNATNLSVLPGQKLCGAASERPAVTTCPSTVDGTAGSRPKPAGGAGGALGSARLVGWRQTAPELRKCSLS